MKRLTCLLCAFLLLALTACSKPAAEEPIPSEEPSPAPTVEVVPTPEPEPSVEPEPEPEPEPSEEPDAPYHNPLTGEGMEEDTENRKPVAIIMNNIRAAMPQHGNSMADIIYEVPAEGGITRMLGVFHDVSQVGRIGSVRSARLYYLELALGHDAIFVHAGGSPEFYEKKQAWSVTTYDGVNGPYASSSIFFRDRNRYGNTTYAYEHSLLTRGDLLAEFFDKNDVKQQHSGYTYTMSFAEDGTPVNGEDAATITVSFGGKRTKLTYNSEDGKYYLEQYDSKYIDGNDKSQVAVTNGLFLSTKCTVVDEKARITVDLTSGTGHYACGGKIIPIKWEKGSRGNQLKYYTMDGQPLTLGVGKSYVAIYPNTQTISYQG